MKNNLIIAAIALLIGFGLGSQMFPKIKTQTVEVTKEQVVKDVVTQIKVVTRPDGTKEEVTVITDKSKENKESKQSKTVVAKNDWHISVGAEAKDFKFNDPSYNLHIERRVLGGVFVGGSISTQKSVGLSIGIEF